MRLNRERWLNSLQKVSAGLATREMMEQSACFVFQDEKIITFNDELLCVANLPTGITGAVHAKTLMDLLLKSADEDLEVKSKATEDDETNLHITGRNFHAELTMASEISLPIDTVEAVHDWKTLHGEFGDALEVVQGSASHDDLHFNLTCIHLTPEYVESCDGYQCTRYNIKTGLSEGCLIKKESVKSLIGLGMDKVSEGKNWIHFSGDGIDISCRRWVQDYVDIDQLIAFSGKPTTLPGGLAEAVARAEIFSSQSGSENQVMVLIRKGRLEIRGIGAHGRFKERSKLAYDGDDISFMASPKLLTEITKRTNEVQITKERLKIDAGKFVYVACMSEVEE